ncbi:MAG: hypothetical protein LBU48_03165, partial [Coriobacteriales bacterium]|nr:hypothetical protein [Coriobacteriales bacterium]
ETLFLAEHSAFGSSIAAYRRDIKPCYVSSVFHGAYRREVFEKVGFFDERLIRTEDNEMHYRIRQAGYRIRFNPKIRSQQFIRNSLKDVIKQKYSNGYWIGRTLFISPRCLQIYHLVPFLFVLALAATTAVGFAWTWLPLAALGFLYGLVNLPISLMTFIRAKNKNASMVVLPAVFLIMHIVYGWGTLIGTIKGFFGTKEPFDVFDVPDPA